MAENINIGGRLHSVATGNVVAGANEIFDDAEQKRQSEINAETLRVGESYGEEVIPELNLDNVLLKRQQTLTFQQKEAVIGNILDRENSVLHTGMGKKYLKENLGYFGLPFDGVIDMNITIKQMSYDGSNYRILWSSYHKGFVAHVSVGLLNEYYASWQDSGAYMFIENGTKFVANDTPYVYDSTTEDKLIVDASARRGNQLTQDMMTEANTIYTIEYDFDLNGMTVTVPDNSLLLFNGGSLDNGTLVCGDHTSVFNTVLVKEVFGADLVVQGTYNGLQPVALSGNYNDLSNKPEIPEVPTKLSDLTNDVGFVTGAAVEGTLEWYVSTIYFTNNFKFANLPDKPTIPASISDLEDGSDVVTTSILATALEGYVTTATLEGLSYNSLQDKPDLSLYATAQSLDAAEQRLNASIAGKMSADDAYTKAQINNMITNSKAVNKTLGMKTIKGIGAVADTWKVTVLADESTLIWTDDGTKAYIYLDAQTVFGNDGIQIDVVVNGTKLDSTDAAKVRVSLIKGTSEGTLNIDGMLYSDLSDSQSTFFTTQYLPWVSRTSWAPIRVEVTNINSSALAFSSSDSISLIIKTKGENKKDGYAFVVDKQDIYASTEWHATINTSDGRDVFLWVLNTLNGNMTAVHESAPNVATADNVPYQLTQNDYNFLTAELADDFKELLVVPVQEGSLIDTSVKLSISNQTANNS